MRHWFAKRRIGDLPAESAERWGQREALMYQGRRWSFASLAEEVERVARALIGAGVAPGDRVAMWIGNRPEFLFVYFAIIRVGAIAVPLNTRYRTLDLAYALRQSRSATLITVERAGPVDFGAMVREVLGETRATAPRQLRAATFPDLRRVIWVESGTLAGSCDWNQFMAAGEGVAASDVQRRAAAVDADAPAMIMYTSGTTGNPKGVMLDHSGLRVASDRNLLFGMTTADVNINYLPLFHLFSLGVVVLGSMMAGARQVLMETFDPDLCLPLIEAEAVTMLYGFDTHYRDMMLAKERHAEPVDLSSLRSGLFAAGLDSSLPIALATQRQLGPTQSGFGMTETWATVSVGFLSDDEDRRCRASGYPMPGWEVRIVDPDTGLDVAPEVQGEILVRGYSLMKGYWDDAAATAKAIDAEGWLHTGDAGLLRADGHLRFTGRYKDMLKVGGENMAPAEIEELLLRLDEVAEVAVVGAPDPRLAEVPVAFVVRRAGSDLSEAALIEHCRGRVASYKIPRRAIFVEALPMTASGKVQKEKLRQSLRS